ncbi:Bcr/CflA family multidrug efflux MFS transporter [Pseudomonas sp. R5(2019)]|uniref:Bcr/CflA family multidrug efflux MFS transporter n=1 Tax=Pseudomonas sp. R5(2019) TaxID=2697566 RepID=UPI001412B158|nr:Bcr/CflA family multidrug efflux MFS transporter [Pseudomonas sp. R5(2019)]NBA97548.1 Bcr/CflA family multidrug efflux MFS transporter [Pseudomonas sp. R5(2019)]
MSSISRPERLIVLLAALVAFAPLSIDTYLPSLPMIASDLGADPASVQMTIGVFLAGLCLGMLFYGPLSDRYGRRPLLLGGMVLYLMATVGCMLASDIQQLIVWRFFQALGGAAASVLARAIVRDLFPLNDAARVLSLMHLVTMLATLVAPLVGSFLMMIEGWRTIFVGLLAFAALCLLASALRIQETHAADSRGRSLGAAFGAYWQIVRQPRALGYIGCMGLSFGGMFAFITASPFVYMAYFGVSPQAYGWLFGLNIGGVILVTLLNARIVQRAGPLRMLGWGATAAGLSGALLLAVGISGVGGLAAVVACVIVYVSVTGLLGANCVASLLALYPRQAGAAAGLAVACQFALGAGFSALVSAAADGTPLPMCAAIAAAGLGCTLCYLGVCSAAKSFSGDTSIQ